jgi:methionyl-tRNA synthetase
MNRPRPSEDDRPVLLLGPNPTPNGGMHLGHIAGPYLAGDVYARYQRARGRDVIFTTGTDDSQTYVLASARRQGVDPHELCRTSTELIKEALTSIGISFDGFGPFDDEYRDTVLEFFRTLHAAGKFKLKTVELPYSEELGEYVVEGMIEGECPVCLTTSRGGLCETCVHPNNYDDPLIEPHSTVDPNLVLTTREATILVFPLEEYREELTAYHEQWIPYWRPHLGQMIREILAKPLPEIPITYPLPWGMDPGFPEVPGQVLNAWLELMPAGMFTTAYAARQLGRDTKPGELWESGNLRMVHVLGFDNAFFFCISHIALLMAHGDRYLRPEWIINNEFYELESEKFSTSKRHVVTPQEILQEVPRDVVRLYLALTAPEHARTTFSRVGLDRVAAGRLVGPWNRLAEALGKKHADLGGNGTTLPVTALGRRRAAAMYNRFDASYEMPTYSLSRSADQILVHIERLARRSPSTPEEWGDLFLETKALLRLASPILIDLAEAAGFTDPLKPGVFEVSEVAPFTPPLIPQYPPNGKS